MLVRNLFITWLWVFFRLSSIVFLHWCLQSPFRSQFYEHYHSHHQQNQSSHNPCYYSYYVNFKLLVSVNINVSSLANWNQVWFGAVDNLRLSEERCDCLLQLTGVKVNSNWVGVSMCQGNLLCGGADCQRNWFWKIASIQDFSCWI